MNRQAQRLIRFGMAVVCASLVFVMPGCAASKPTVVVYTSRDQLYAEPMLKAFERETGIQVQAIYDTGATKTVGLTNRLLAEKDHPQADVFGTRKWSERSFWNVRASSLRIVRPRLAVFRHGTRIPKDIGPAWRRGHAS